MAQVGDAVVVVEAGNGVQGPWERPGGSHFLEMKAAPLASPHTGAATHSLGQVSIHHWNMLTPQASGFWLRMAKLAWYAALQSAVYYLPALLLLW